MSKAHQALHTVNIYVNVTYKWRGALKNNCWIMNGGCELKNDGVCELNNDGRRGLNNDPESRFIKSIERKT